MTDTTPADQLRAAAYRAGTPAELATLLTRLADASDHHGLGEGGVVATLVHPALAVARQLLGTSAAEGATAVPSADRRARYAAAIREADGWVLDDGQHMIDAVMAVADAEQASLRAEAEGLDEALRGAISASEKDGARLPAAPPAPADRAAVLREAAEVAVRAARACGESETGQYAASVAAGIGRDLRRLADDAAAGVQPPTTGEADSVLAAAIPEWEAVYEPGNVSDYLIGYANSEAAAKGAAIAWVLSQTDKAADRLDWDPQNWNDRHDAWFDLVERHDDGVDTGVGVTVRHRLHPYTAADFAPEDDEQPAAPAAPEEQR